MRKHRFARARHYYKRLRVLIQDEQGALSAAEREQLRAYVKNYINTKFPDLPHAYETRFPGWKAFNYLDSPVPPGPGGGGTGPAAKPPESFEHLGPEIAPKGAGGGAGDLEAAVAKSAAPTGRGGSRADGTGCGRGRAAGAGDAGSVAGRGEGHGRGRGRSADKGGVAPGGIARGGPRDSGSRSAVSASGYQERSAGYCAREIRTGNDDNRDCGGGSRIAVSSSRERDRARRSDGSGAHSPGLGRRTRIA
jgi:hypothetical protein